MPTKNIRLNTRSHMARKMSYRNVPWARNNNRRLMHLWLFRTAWMGEVDNSTDIISNTKWWAWFNLVNLDRNNAVANWWVVSSDWNMLYEATATAPEVNTDWLGLTGNDPYTLTVKIKTHNNTNTSTRASSLFTLRSGSLRWFGLQAVWNSSWILESIYHARRDWIWSTNIIAPSTHWEWITATATFDWINMKLYIDWVLIETKLNTRTMVDPTQWAIWWNNHLVWSVVKFVWEIAYARAFNKELTPEEVISEYEAEKYSTINDWSLVWQWVWSEFTWTESAPWEFIWIEDITKSWVKEEYHLDGVNDTISLNNSKNYNEWDWSVHFKARLESISWTKVLFSQWWGWTGAWENVLYITPSWYFRRWSAWVVTSFTWISPLQVWVYYDITIVREWNKYILYVNDEVDTRTVVDWDNSWNFFLGSWFSNWFNCHWYFSDLQIFDKAMSPWWVYRLNNNLPLW